jgi:hypothetical protein
MEVSGQLHVPVALPHRERAPRWPLDRKLGGPQSRSGRCGEEQNLSSAGYGTPAVQLAAIATELFTKFSIKL